jgi:CTP:molybdopterin cytidylyltransferase MocA
MVLQPSYHGQHGHPVRILRPVTDALLSAPVTGAARDVIRRYERAFLEVDDPGVVLDADDPAAFAQLQERLA